MFLWDFIDFWSCELQVLTLLIIANQNVVDTIIINYVYFRFCIEMFS